MKSNFFATGRAGNFTRCSENMAAILSLMIAAIAVLLAQSVVLAAPPVSDDPRADYSRDIQPLLTKYCAGCHNAREANAELDLESYTGLMQGGENGAVIQPRSLQNSRLLGVIVGTAQPRMPPADEPQLAAEEVKTLEAWITAGAMGPISGGKMELAVPVVRPTTEVREPARAIAFSAEGTSVAIGRDRAVDLYAVRDGQLHFQRRFAGPAGQVNGLFLLSANRMLTAGGEPGLPGETALWDLRTGQALWKQPAHRDAISAAALSYDGKLLATGSYDQTVELRDIATGERQQVLTGHNGPVFDLAFHPSDHWLASASGDRTIKLWNRATGQRLDTLIEPLKDQTGICFSADGQRLVAVGADSRIRVWSITDEHAARTQLMSTHFAHEAPIVALGYSASQNLLFTASEDGWLKQWQMPSRANPEVVQVGTPRRQSDWVNDIAVNPAGNALLLARLDGSLELQPCTPVTPMAAAERADVPAASLASASGSWLDGSLNHLQTAIFEGDLLPLEAPRASRILANETEQEPNDLAGTANRWVIPGSIQGLLQAGVTTSSPENSPTGQQATGQQATGQHATGQHATGQHATGQQSGDLDLFRVHLTKGEQWVFETLKQETPADTVIDLLTTDGHAVERLRLRATRDSAINFRAIAADRPGVRVDHWEEMQLNDYLYFSGEVCRIFRMPRGPDSDMLLYASGGKRSSYLGTTGVAHALGEPAFVVEPVDQEAEVPRNGLPVFPLFYQNDDAEQADVDSRLLVTAAETGDYLIRVRDVRGFEGPDYRYTLTARRAQPTFEVSLEKQGVGVPAGSGQALTITAVRHDGFEGPIAIAFDEVPAGFTISSPVVIEAGHYEAKVVINASSAAVTPESQAGMRLRIRAMGMPNNTNVRHAVKPPVKVEVVAPAKLQVRLTPLEGRQEIVIEPGGRVRANLSILRRDFDGEMKFEVENLPHGVIVDHIGLSGILVRAGETERQIELHCADWVLPTSRWVFAVSEGQGQQASSPVLFRVIQETKLAEQP